MMKYKCRVLVLGASGMLGSAVLRYISGVNGFEVFGAARSPAIKRHFGPPVADRMLIGHDVCNEDHLLDLFEKVKPGHVINCVGLVKQLDQAKDPLTAIPVNSLLPHRLANLCRSGNARLIHLSTDCVFSGAKGGYLESDSPDADDVYGRSKLLGEVVCDHAITLRTSIIGHELDGARSLINWFLSREGRIRGYTQAIFSGLPTVEIARIIVEHVVPNPSLHGLYHVSAGPISKFDLLTLVASEYGKQIKIEPDDSVVINRSLDSSRFQQIAGFNPKPWPELIRRMREFG
jgi:dTDP-4-dehydrorhamnose reductase